MNNKELTVENVEEVMATINKVSVADQPDGEIRVDITNGSCSLNYTLERFLKQGWVVSKVAMAEGYILLAEAGVETEEREVTKTVEETVITTKE